jgi:hypothetical protein
LLEAAGSTANELIKGRDLAKHIALPATANAAPWFVLIGDDYVLRSIYVFVAAVVSLCICEIGARSFDESVDDW